jgi:hypothetical protein
MKNAGGADVFMSPERDIAHAFSGYVFRTFDIVTNPASPMMQWYYENGGKEEDLVLAARFFRKFLEITQGKPEIGLLSDVVKEAGYGELPLMVRLVVGHAFMNVGMSAFFQGFREATTKPCEPNLEIEIGKPYGLIRRTLRAGLRKLLYWIS